MLAEEVMSPKSSSFARRERAEGYNHGGMALTRGTKLGPYEISTPLGAGGMGEVYRARDARLGRSVAIKILPAQFLIPYASNGFAARAFE